MSVAAAQSTLDLATQSLSPQYERALARLVQAGTMKAVHGGWKGGGQSLSLYDASALAVRGLATIRRIGTGGANSTITATLAGRLRAKDLDHATAAKAYSEVDHE